jgi:uncharacterized protein YoxC
MAKFKIYLSYLFLVATFVVSYRCEPIAAMLFAVLLAFILLCFWLHIYFMPIKAKLENIAKTKRDMISQLTSHTK